MRSLRYLIITVVALVCLLIIPAAALADGFRFPVGDGRSQPATTLWMGESWDSYFGHLGEDYGYDEGTIVRAAFAGTVIYSGRASGKWGRVIVLRHDDASLPGGRVFTQYAHLSRRFVHLGDHVATFQRIGEVGGSGGWLPHLHFEIKSGAKLGRGYRGATFSGDVAYDPATEVVFFRPSWFIRHHRKLRPVEAGRADAMTRDRRPPAVEGLSSDVSSIGGGRRHDIMGVPLVSMRVLVAARRPIGVLRRVGRSLPSYN